MRILHTSDWHLGRKLEGRSRHEEQVAFIDEICQIVEHEKIDLVLVAGDVFDSFNPPAEAEELYYEALERLSAGGRRAVVVIAGNHDHPDRLCAATALAGRYGIVLAGRPGAEVLLRQPEDYTSQTARVTSSGKGWVRIAIPGVEHVAALLLLPYPSEASLGEFPFDSSNENESSSKYSQRISSLITETGLQVWSPELVNIAVTHLFVRGGETCPESERPIQAGGAFIVEPESFPDLCQYVALGHLHKPQRIMGPVTMCYSGAPLCYAFSEAAQTRSVTVVEVIPGGVPLVKEIVLAAGRPLLEWDIRGGFSELSKHLEDERDHKAWINVNFHVDQPIAQEELLKLRAAHPGILNVRLVLDNSEHLHIPANRRGMPIGEAFADFYELQTGTKPGPELTELFLEVISSDDGNE